MHVVRLSAGGQGFRVGRWFLAFGGGGWKIRGRGKKEEWYGQEQEQGDPKTKLLG